MKKISHSKYRNSGIIFEILVRHLTNEAISNSEPKTINIIKKYFSLNELSKENQLYQTLIKQRNLTESNANTVLNTIVELYGKLDIKKLNKEKYNLIKEIKDNYDFDKFFATKIPNYKILASLYTILESTKNPVKNPQKIVKSKLNLIEHLTISPTQQEESDMYHEMKQLDKGDRFLVYKMMLEKFNSKYKGLNNSQKLILKEYINSVSLNNDKLIKLVKENFTTVKNSLKENLNNITDKVTQIKLNSILSYIDPILKQKHITEDNINLLFQYQDLEEKLKNGEK